MKIKFWGVRGSVPSPLVAKDIRSKLERVLERASPRDIMNEESIKYFLDTLPYSLVGTYGGNTTCVEIRSKNNELIIIDGGTGLTQLSKNMMTDENFSSGKGEAHCIFTHTHWDHIQGIPFFAPLYIPGNTFHIHGVHENLEQRLKYQHNPNFFPVNFDQMPAAKYFYQHTVEEIWELYGISICQVPLRHPGVSYSYRFEENGKVFVFCTDVEFSFHGNKREELEKYIKHFQDADVMVFDTQYIFEDQIQKIDWGHSSALVATDIAIEAGVKNLVLFHHDPSYSDDKLDEAFLVTEKYKNYLQENKPSDIEITIAYEGLEIVL